VALYFALGNDTNASHRIAHFYRPAGLYSGPAVVYTQSQMYDPGCSFPGGYGVYRSYYSPYPIYAGTPFLPELLRSMPLGWNRYYLTSRLQAPYSLILRNNPPYSGYREVESREAEPKKSTAAKPPVTVHTIPPRDISAPPPETEETVQISRGMTEDQVKSLLGQPMIQVVLGDARSYVYDRFVVEFEKGRVKNVVFK
jgi:hypothetical protein